MLRQHAVREWRRQQREAHVKFFGQFNPPVDKVIYDRYFGRSLLRGTYIECGAGDGISESSCYFFEKYMGWRAINIECSPPLYERLCANRPTSINLQIALSDAPGSVTFKHAIHPVIGEVFGNGSVSHAPSHIAELDAMGCTYVDYEVPAVTYNQVIADQGVTQLDLMVLDIEGYEMTALRGMAGATVLPTVMCVEFGHVGLDRLVDELSQFGYYFDMVADANAFFLLGSAASF